MLRAGVSAVGCHELTIDDDLSGERQWRELRVVGQTAALVSTICHHRAGLEPRDPEPGCSLAEGVLINPWIFWNALPLEKHQFIIIFTE